MNDRTDGATTGGRVGAKRPERDPATATSNSRLARAAASGAGSGRSADADNEAHTAAELADRLHAEHEGLQAELTEIQMLVQQARTEADRHESKRAAAAQRIASMSAAGANPAEIAELNRQLVTLTRRASVMQGSVDVLDGKVKVLARYREATARMAEDLDRVSAEEAGGMPLSRARGIAGRARAAAEEEDDPGEVLPLALSRIVLNAQEDLRREIARTMHDGPAQSLTNIVLQAQIVERLIARDPTAAQPEVRQLISMVQQTLDATKSFIFDVRPMVLDDLGLVPTIRRAARERGRRAQIPVEFESYGSDRRLAMELESGLFRILDETLAAYLAGRPDRISIRLDWSEGLEARIAAHRTTAPSATDAAPSSAAAAADARADTARNRGRGKAPQPRQAMPAALAAMIEDRQAAESAARRAVGAIPAVTRREIHQRAATLGIILELIDDGRELRLTVEAPAIAE